MGCDDFLDSIGSVSRTVGGDCGFNNLLETSLSAFFQSNTSRYATSTNKTNKTVALTL
jgi:hypothetical protein